jgi:hypothetical protein
VDARWKPVFFISALMLVAAVGLFLTSTTESGRVTAGGLFISAAALLYIAVRNGKAP